MSPDEAGVVRRVAGRLRHEASVWRQEPIKRVVDANRLMRPIRVRQFGEYGEGSVVDRPVWLYGTRHISIGRQVLILRGAWLAVERIAWDRSEPVLRIGDRVGIRTSCTITAAASIVIEDDVTMGGYVTIIDSKHVWGGSDNVLTAPVEAAPVRIGRGTWIGDKATIAAGATIGARCMIASNSVVSGTVPDFSIVVGNPGRVIGSTRDADGSGKPQRAVG